ncbi:MAG TPA: hypothetical protein VFB52_13560, partial [Solirubrobacterales bacterium]|nr:hypothetical protein [Solirubrobacterales bacterium]
NRVFGEYSEDSEGLLTLEEAFDGALVFEVGSSGQAGVTGGGVNIDDVPLSSYAGEFHALAIAPRFMQMNDIALRRGEVEEGAQRTLELSENYGAPGSWTAISPSMVTISAAETIEVPNGVSFVKISGTTAVKTITPTTPGHVLTAQLITAGGNIYTMVGNLKLSSNHGAGNLRGTLTMICDGTYWYELSHSNN